MVPKMVVVIFVIEITFKLQARCLTCLTHATTLPPGEIGVLSAHVAAPQVKGDDRPHHSLSALIFPLLVSVHLSKPIGVSFFSR